jgi:hypothetical protein
MANLLKRLLDLIGLAGDATGTVGRNVVEKIHGTPVSATAPIEGQVMIFQEGQWRPAALPASSPNISTDILLFGDVIGPSNNTKIQMIQDKVIAATDPIEGQALLFKGGQWRPAALPARSPNISTDIPLFGDVIGPSNNTKIQMIQGKVIAATDPIEGQVMIFQGGQWRPAALPASPPNISTDIPLFGDVIGPSNNTKVQMIHGKVIADTAPIEGQALLFQGGQWTPASPTYSIIAAGIFSVTGQRKPDLGQVRLALVLNNNNTPIDGCLLIEFTGYSAPTSKFTYIVKALAVCDANAKKQLLVSPLVNFDQFTSKGIQIWVTEAGKPISATVMGKMEFVIEIGLYQCP